MMRDVPIHKVEVSNEGEEKQAIFSQSYVVYILSECRIWKYKLVMHEFKYNHCKCVKRLYLIHEGSSYSIKMSYWFNI